MGRYTASIPSPPGGWWAWGVTGLGCTIRYTWPLYVRHTPGWIGSPAANSSSQVASKSGMDRATVSGILVAVAAMARARVMACSWGLGGGAGWLDASFQAA